jgi:E3 ubiquitin-protein ligase CHFR
VYECFDGNAVEVEIMLDYLGTQNISPRQIYCEASLPISVLKCVRLTLPPSSLQVVQHILSQPRKFAPLIELDLFVDVHSVPPGPEPGLDAPRQRICRMCAVEVLLYGLKDWWIRERKKGLLDATVSERPDCLDGPACRRQKEHGMLCPGPHSA